MLVHSEISMRLNMHNLYDLHLFDVCLMGCCFSLCCCHFRYGGHVDLTLLLFYRVAESLTSQNSTLGIEFIQKSDMQIHTIQYIYSLFIYLYFHCYNIFIYV
jgi:hypothetical protein